MGRALALRSGGWPKRGGFACGYLVGIWWVFGDWYWAQKLFWK